MRPRFVVSAAMILLVSLAAHADTLAGDQVQSQFFATGFGVYAGPVTTTAPGSVSPYPGIVSTGTFSVTYTDTTITLLSAGGETIFGSGYTFNGIEFDILTGTPFATASIDPATTLPGFTSGDLALTGGMLDANLDGLTFAAGQELVIDVTTASASATPEPSSLALLGTGLLGVVGVVRKRFA